MFIAKTTARQYFTAKFLSLNSLFTCLALTTLMSSMSVSAQTDGTTEQRSAQSNKASQSTEHKQKREPNWQRLAQRLNLGDTQKEGFVAAMSRYHQRRVELRQSSGLKEAMQEIDQEVERELANILSEEQLAQFISHREEKKRRHHQRSNGKKKEKRG